MTKKTPWYKNAKIWLDGGTLHIAVELDESKVETSRWEPDDVVFASVAADIEGDPPLKVNVHVRTTAARRGEAAMTIKVREPKLAAKSKTMICPNMRCRRTICVIRGTPEPDRCPQCDTKLK